MKLICGLFVLFVFVMGHMECAWADACDDQRASLATSISACLSWDLVGCGPPGVGPSGPSAARVNYEAGIDGTTYVYCQLQYCPDWGSEWYIGGLTASCHPNLTTSGMATTIPKPINACGSIIQTTNQVVGESIPVVGAPFELTYFSNRVVGRLADYEGKSIITSATVPSTVTSYDLTIRNEVGATVYSNSYGTSANQTYTYTWNGQDASSVETWGPLIYSFDMKENASDFSPELTKTVRLGNLKAKKLGLGGWLPSIWHYYNVATKTLFKGDGTFRDVDFVMDGSYYRVADEDASLVFYFNSDGTIAYTKLGLTGTTIYTFSYDGYGHLSTIVEPFSRTTTFNYSSGVLTSIVAPNGKTTTTALDGNGYLYTVTNPNSEVFTMTYYSTHGLLDTFTKPNGNVSTMTYDGLGNLTADSHSGGYSTSLSKTDATVTSTSAEGLVTTNVLDPIYGVETQTKPSGYSWMFNSTNSTESTTIPEGSQQDTFNDDPRFGSQARVKIYSYLSNFGNRNTAITYTATLASGDPYSITTYQTVADVGNSEITSTYTGSTKTNVTSTKLGRTHTSVIDAYQRLTSDQQGSLTATAFTYTNELLTQIAQGTRTTTLAYNGTTKLLTSITDPLSEVTAYTYDSAERLASKTLPDLRVIGYSYDSEGNLSTITPPSRPAHTFNFGTNEMMSSYVPPSLSGVLNVTTSYSYNNDRKLTQISRPDGNTITFNYDATSGLMTSITGGFGTITQSYTNEKPLQRIDQNGANEFITYYGKIPSYSQFSDSTGTIGYNFNRYPDSTAGEKIGTETVNGNSGTQTINYTYDDDEFLTGIGDLTLSYNTPNGQLTGTVIGNVNDAYTYNSFGEVTGYTAKYNTTPIYSYTLTRDDLGRVSEKVETLGGVTTTFDYTYDVAGRLTQVKKNSVTDSTYSYDDNSNRTGGSIHGSSTSGTYNNQDWMTAFNANTYTYNANGETLTRYNSTTGVTTTFTWDPFGNVQSVQVGSTTYNYGITPSYHRYEKSVGGVIQNIYAYNPEGRLIGELDSSSALKKTFVYGTKSNVPDYYIDDSSNEFRIISDQIGSVRLVVNVATGTVAQLMEHDEFGRVLQDTSPGLQPFGFAGGLYDKDTGYVLFGARTYDPESGRWLSKDPILFDGGDTNLMGYAFSDPVNFIDPSGLSDLVLYSPGDPIILGDSKIPNQPGTFSVGGHGNPIAMRGRNGKPVTPTQLAAMILKSKDYAKGQSVKLNSCSTGGSPSGGGAPFAQQLANILGVKVIAPTTELGVSDSGKTILVPPTGTWNTFNPQ